MAIYNYALAALVLSNLSTSAMSSMTFTAMTKENLIDKFISADGDVEFSNIKASTHYSKCTRYYTGGHSMGYAWLNDDNATLTDTYLLPDEGIILSSGDPRDFPSNDSDQETTRWYNSETYYYDSDLAATINNQAIFDACFIEFDFKCSGEGYVPQVSFKYLFGSEEYYEYVDSPYNDAFALILNGVNIAKLPSSESESDVVSINNVNYHLNRQYFHGNDPGTGDLADPMHDDLGMIYPQIEPDGFTLIMTAHGIPHQNPQQTNTIKIVVGDVGDGILDSWVLLQSGTFSCVDITEAPSVSLQPSNAPTLKPSVSKAPTLAPSASPTLSTAPTAAPSVAPTISVAPTGQPSASPSVSTQPSAEPTANPSLSKSPSANPTSAPSVSSAPTDKPSASPSTSTKPSSVPSSNPTLSSSPSVNPTTSPSISVAPTGQPSASPSISAQPSAEPTANPSLSKSPSANPTDSPSISSAPTDEPSASPSISTKPSGQPTSSPSLSSSPSANPTDSPSVSTAPTDQPSASPSTSTQPSGNPTASPSLSSSPSANPTDSPSISSAPSANPTSAPSSSSVPTDQPSASPSVSTKPTSEPSLNPSLSSEPSSEPSLSPSVSTKPSSEPSASPSTSTSPTASPSSVPTAAPSSIPTVTHSTVPSLDPTVSSSPSVLPSSVPSVSTAPQGSPSANPTVSLAPTTLPSLIPTISSAPSSMPSLYPTISAMPTSVPSLAPSISSAPTDQPSASPSVSTQPSEEPSSNPTLSSSPSANPTSAPSSSSVPTDQPSASPSLSTQPTSEPSTNPSMSPSANPTSAPSANPTDSPSISQAPTDQPSASPSLSTQPSAEPTANPSLSSSPSDNPTDSPSISSAPTEQPSASPSISSQPSAEPSSNPTLSSSPSANPTDSPSISSAPTDQPSASPSISSQPSAEPSSHPSLSSSPSANPTDSPSISSAPTDQPSASPSVSTQPSAEPSSNPSLSSSPSSSPSSNPSLSSSPSANPTDSPSSSSAPTDQPSASPSISAQPSAEPSSHPSLSSSPSANPSDSPSISSAPTDQPSASPSISTQPSAEPSLNPSLSSEPSSEPSLSPSVSTEPTSEPSASPSTSTSPTASPSSVPTAAPSSIPTVTHSTVPSLDPTVSSSPSVLPSSVPSVSTAPQGSPSILPTISLAPTTLPSLIPTISSAPSSMPSLYPTISAMPTSVPSLAPSSSPTQKPSASPSVTASEKPSVSKQPSGEPSSTPSLSSSPSSSPSAEPSVSKEPTGSPSSSPSVSSSPSSQPTEEPSISKQPSHEPSSAPSLSTRPTSSPSAEPSVSPTQEPSASPSLTASDKPSVSSSPSSEPTEKPSISQEPTSVPSLSPTVSSKPSSSPSAEPSISKEPTGSPSSSPSVSSSPSSEPTAEPSVSKQPSHEPSAAPSLSSSPSSSPSAEPSVSPSSEPSANPSLTASGKPSVSSSPSLMASEKPSISKQPSREPTSEPSLSTSPTSSPSATPSVSKEPTGGPTLSPTVSNSPSSEPTANPSLSTEPSTSPSSSPSKSSEPSSHPTSSPSTSSKPSDEPSLAPSKSSQPSASPTDDTYMPSVSLKPSSSPTGQPSISSAPSSAPSKMASVGPNTVFNDLNADGFQDENEEGLVNITVVLYNATDDSPVATTETDENGVYEFNELTAGSYYATVLNVTYYFSPVQEGGNQATANVDGPNGNTPTVELSAGGVIDDWNVGLYEPVTVGNRVWLDYNADGVHDEDEPGLGNITVVLVDQSGNPIEGQVQMSDPEGYYLFTGLPPGVYGVEFIVPDDYNFSPQNPLSDSIDRSDPNAGDYAADIDSSGMAAPAELESGTADLSFDAGIYAPITISGTIFLDLSADGIRDAEEVDGVEGVTLILYDSVNNVTLEEAVTSADGSYAFPPMPPGLYHVELLVPSEEYLVSPLAEGGNTFDTSYDPAKTSAVRVISGFDAENLFDGALYEKATTSLYVWFDSNGNGLQDEGESPYSNATVNIYESNSTTPVATVAVASDGTFTYDIAPGSYTVEVVVSDADAVFSPQDQGSDDTIDSDVDADGRISITVASGEEINMSAGVTAMPEVASCVFLDSNGNGLQDEGEPPLSYVEVQLYHANGTLVDVTTSDETCLYEFTAPHVGDYFVTVVLPPEHELSPVVDGGNQISSNEDGTNSSPVVTLTLGYVEDSWDVGMYVPVSIGNRVWNDLNGDGIQGGDEPGIENIMVSLNNQDGSEIATTATDSTGHYLFEGLSPGNYSVQFQLPDEFLFTIPAKTTADIVDPVDGSYAYEDVTSDADRDTGSTPVTMVLSGTSNLSLDAGMFIPVSINGTTWQDTNADGFLDEGEPALEGATIILYDVDGDIAAGTSAVVVDESGVWNVDGLPPGTYSALIEPPSGEWSLSPIPETEGNVTSTNFDPADSKTTPVYLQSGDSGWGHFDAGFYLPASVGDRVWFDEEPNGIQDFGEPPMDGPISVKLYDSLGYLQGETETSAGGFYQFTNLRPGTYEIEFALPSEDFNFAILKAGEDDALDSDVNPKTGRAQVTLVSGEINDNVDAGIMDSAPYYPDWTNDVQVCTNDGFDPAWLQIQEVNYLYSSKEACCKQHFWWRMTQCMANEEFKFYQKEDKCDTKVVFEDWESNTPDLFHGGETTLFDTLEECCAHKFWFDYDGCLGRSPLIYKFEFCVDIQDLAVPLDCQSADIYGQVLEHAFNVNADIGLGEVDAAITKIGDASLEKVAGNTVCGGSLEGTFTNDLTGSNPDIDGAAGTTTEVCGTMTVEAGNDCADETCLMAQYQQVSQALTEASTTGSLTDSIRDKAITRLPPVPELQSVDADNVSIYDVLMPATITGDLETKFFFGTDLSTCSEKPTITFAPGDANYDTLHACCTQHFGWDIAGCCTNGGGCPELPPADDPADDVVDGYYPTWDNTALCRYKSGFESWEERFDTLEACCTAKFNYDTAYDNCMNPTNP